MVVPRNKRGAFVGPARPATKVSSEVVKKMKESTALHNKFRKVYLGGTFDTHTRASSSLLRKLMATAGYLLLVSKFVNDPDDKVNYYEREGSEYPEELRPGYDMGSLYKQRINYYIGSSETKSMKTAKDLYGTNKYPLFNSAANPTYPVMTQLYSSCGSNRKGVWAPFGWNWGMTSTDKEYFASHQQYSTLLSPTLSWFNWIYNNQMSDEMKTWLADGAQGAGDAYFPICNIIDTVTFSNYNQFVPVEYSVYICQCKRSTVIPPSTSWYSLGFFSNEAVQMPNAYTYAVETEVLTDPDNKSSTFTLSSETSVHVGSTPYFSPEFRTNWEVLDVVKFDLEPSDKMELTINRHFRRTMSIRDMESYVIDYGNVDAYYQEGDLALLVTFKGKPCFLQYFPSADEPSPNPAAIRDVDCAPSKIAVHSRSEMIGAFPDTYETHLLNDMTTNPDGYISSKSRDLDITLQTTSYKSNWKPVVMTNTFMQQGGSKG